MNASAAPQVGSQLRDERPAPPSPATLDRYAALAWTFAWILCGAGAILGLVTIWLVFAVSQLPLLLGVGLSLAVLGAWALLARLVIAAGRYSFRLSDPNGWRYPD